MEGRFLGNQVPIQAQIAAARHVDAAFAMKPHLCTMDHITSIMTNDRPETARSMARTLMADGSKFVHFHEASPFPCPPHPKCGEQLLDFASLWSTVDRRSFFVLPALVLHQARSWARSVADAGCLVQSVRWTTRPRSAIPVVRIVLSVAGQ